MRDTGRAGNLLRAAEKAGVAERIEVERLDVTDRASVANCPEIVLDRYGRLDAVVNNAGAGFLGTVEQEGMAPVRAAVEVDSFGVVEVTRPAMPYLRAGGGRVVTVTSVGGVVGQPFNEAYCAARFAVEALTADRPP
ncbi:SDR family NAD(P)-dependent oxidoreductase [Kitasatospora sp. NPDC101157]|uniref:SDR family NAD(P)-dependent oxidoreductase n=1 Tax=Kitasatospora sp. NPDC101157 TaxID=3364098 RepID=UPI00382121FA